jgi:hypothetical protein
MEIVPNQTEVKQIATKILLEIFVFGTEDKKSSVNRLNEELQKQLGKQRKNKNRARILWYIETKDKSVEEIKEWFNENSSCKYFIYATDGQDYNIPSDFISSTLSKIKKLEDTIKSFKASEIELSKPFIKKDKFEKFEEVS